MVDFAREGRQTQKAKRRSTTLQASVGLGCARFHGRERGIGLAISKRCRPMAVPKEVRALPPQSKTTPRSPTAILNPGKFRNAKDLAQKVNAETTETHRTLRTKSNRRVTMFSGFCLIGVFSSPQCLGVSFGTSAYTYILD